MWSVPPPTIAEATATHDATHIDHVETLSEAIHEQLKAFPEATFHILPANSPHFPILSSNYTSVVLSRNAQITDDYLLPSLHRARLTKDAYEIAEIRKANAISSRAHETVMRVLGQGVRGAIVKGKGAGVERPLLPSEWLIEKEAEAEALFVASCRREGYVCAATLNMLLHSMNL